MDTNRLKQFTVTKRLYDEMPQKKEFIILTRSFSEVKKYLLDNDLMNNVRLIEYQVESGFNPSRAFNLGVTNAKYDNIIITSPEVKPSSDVLAQLSECLDKNIICGTWDEDADGNLTVLVSKDYRAHSPWGYFLAMFRREDIEKINGWDEDFMNGYAYEDNDFGERWNRAGLPFEIREDIIGVHQFHPRTETITGGTTTNLEKFNANNANGITYCKNGLFRDTIN